VASPKLRASLVWKLPGANPGVHDVLCSLSPCPACGVVVSETIHFGDHEPSEEGLVRALNQVYGGLLVQYAGHTKKHG
jgi:hypothetical protein